MAFLLLLWLLSVLLLRGLCSVLCPPVLAPPSAPPMMPGAGAAEYVAQPEFNAAVGGEEGWFSPSETHSPAAVSANKSAGCARKHPPAHGSRRPDSAVPQVDRLSASLQLQQVAVNQGVEASGAGATPAPAAPAGGLLGASWHDIQQLRLEACLEGREQQLEAEMSADKQPAEVRGLWMRA